MKNMSFFEHFEELRARLVKCAIVFVCGFLFLWFVGIEWVFDFLKAPLFSILPVEKQKLYYTGLFENFLTHLKIAGVSSLFLFSPYYFYQIWQFVSPGLHKNEKKFFLPFLVSTTLFFLFGAAFAYYILFPIAFKFFIHFGAPSDTALLTIDAYFTTVLKLLLLFGLAFETPVLIVFLGFLGIVDEAFLKKNRSMALLLISVGCALFAPPDAISMLVLMAPLIVLYEVSIIVVRWISKKKGK